MKTLLLLRHASAAHNENDHARPLSAKGKAEARKIAEKLAEAGHLPRLILTSDAVRTAETAFAVEEQTGLAGLKPEVREESTLYLASAETLLDHIEQTGNEIDEILVVAHNPGLAELAHDLSRGKLNDFVKGFEPATLALFLYDGDDWAEISPAKVRLAAVITP